MRMLFAQRPGGLGPRQSLINIVSSQSDEVWKTPRRLEAFLRDYCPHARREIHGLVLVSQERLFLELQSLAEQLPIDVIVTRLSQQLQDRTGLSESLARWSLESWACALGLCPDDGMEDVLADTVATAGFSTTMDPAVASSPNPSQGLILEVRKMLAQASVESADDALSRCEQALKIVTDAIPYAADPSSLHLVQNLVSSELVRHAAHSARTAATSGNLALATQRWERILDLSPRHSEAITSLKAFDIQYEEGIQEANRFWEDGKPRASIECLEHLLATYSYRDDLREVLNHRRKVYAEVQDLGKEIPALRQSGRWQRLAEVYCRLEYLAPNERLRISREALSREFAAAEAGLKQARASMTAGAYKKAAEESRAVLSQIVDHSEALRLNTLATEALQALSVKSRGLKTALAEGNIREAERFFGQLTDAERRLPGLANPISQLTSLRDLRSRKQRIQLGGILGYCLWLFAGWLTFATSPVWTRLVETIQARRQPVMAAEFAAQFVQALFAGFCLGGLTVAMRGKDGVRYQLFLCVPTFLQLAFLLAWLQISTAIESLREIVHYKTFLAGLSLFWTAVAYDALRGISRVRWLSILAGTFVAGGLIFLRSLLPLPLHGDFANALVAAAITTAVILHLGWTRASQMLALIPFSVIIASILSPAISGPLALVFRSFVTGIVLTLGLIPAVTNASWRVIAAIPLLAMGSALAAEILTWFPSLPDGISLTLLWCWTVASSSLDNPRRTLQLPPSEHP